MAWILLTPDLLLSRLTVAERHALDTIGTNGGEDALIGIIEEVAPDWRGALARVVALDTRPLAVPSEILIHVLADVRFRAFTRLPDSADWNDDRRMEEWRRANHVRDNLGKIQIAPPEPPNVPENPNAGAPIPAFHVPKHYLD